MSVHFLDHFLFQCSYSAERPGFKLCPRPHDGRGGRFSDYYDHDYPSESCMKCSEYPLAVVVRRVRTFPSFRYAIRDMFRSTSRCESGPVCRRNLLRFLVRLLYADAWFLTCASNAFDAALDLDVTPAETAPEIAVLLPYVRRSVYVSGDAQPVYADPVSDWTCTVTRVPETREEFRCMLVQDVVPLLRFQWMTCVVRGKSRSGPTQSIE